MVSASSICSTAEEASLPETSAWSTRHDGQPVPVQLGKLEMGQDEMGRMKTDQVLSGTKSSQKASRQQVGQT
jgi:hypothetical protein